MNTEQVSTFNHLLMTRKEIITNRILDNKTVEEIKESWATNHLYLDLDWDKAEEEQYISSEKIQRMQPEEIVGLLLDRKSYPETADVIHILAVATGRTDQELSDLVFGTGTFDPYEFYEPTPLQKEVLRFFQRVVRGLKGTGIKFSDHDHWPEKYKKEYDQIRDKFPRGSLPENMEDIWEYVERYNKNGTPSWF